jgi:TRAP-type C4-dicarboxylate transport system permease small subunit
MGLDILKQRERELEEKYGTHLVEAVFQPGKVTVVVETLRETPMVVGGMAMPLIVWAILALLGIAGIGIIAYKLSEMAKAIPWEMVVPVAALGFIGLIMYFISR